MFVTTTILHQVLSDFIAQSSHNLLQRHPLGMLGATVGDSPTALASSITDNAFPHKLTALFDRQR